MKNKRVLVTASFFLLMMSSMFFLEAKYEANKFRFYSRYWRHRQNGIQYARESLKNGFRGIEVDVIFKNSKFYLSYEPKDNYSSTDTLEEFLKRTKDYNFNLWIDFKNLGFFNARKACSQLNKLLDDHERFDTTLIESDSFYALHLCRQSKLHASYRMYFKRSSLLEQVKYWISKRIQRKYKFEFVSVDKYADEQVVTELSSQYTTLLYTVRNNEEKEKFDTRKNIRVMLVGKGMPPN
jgi:hypothetical protein